MSGWVTPTTPPLATRGPIAWKAPEETPGLSVSELLRGSWRLYRSAGRRLLLVATIPEAFQALLSLPSIVVAVLAIQGMARVFGDFSRLGTDPVAFQIDFEAAMRPPTDLLVIAALSGGIGIAFLVIGWAALTATALAASEGRPVSVASAFRAAFARKAGIVIPALAVGVVWAAVSAGEALVQPTGRVAMTPSQSALFGLAALLFTGLSVAAVVLAVICSLALPAILTEDLGIRRGLARGAELTRGIRIRLGLAFVVVYILQALTVGILSAVIAVVSGVIARSLEVGVVVYFAVLLIGGVLWLPLLPTMLAVAYRDRTKPDEEVAPDDGAPDVDGAPAIDGASAVGDAG